ncbi:MAG: poly(A) polymerase [Gaiellaceae bacterium]|jgi:tRNA nucleotidyltransferase/poly(A) polymerase|nr:poly(A) polymerase [Gaiellaceae bacterium]
MREAVAETLAGEEAWIVGGAVRDELLGRPVDDLDIACREPERAARAYAGRRGGAPFPISAHHPAWRVAHRDGRTVDFTPLPGTIEEDLGTRDFTINAIAVPLAGGEPVDPFGGRGDLASRTLRVVSPSVFADDPLRLLRAVRLEDELGFELEGETERLVREHAALATRPAAERTVAELMRLSARGYRRAAELGLVESLHGAVPGGDELDRVDSPEYRLVAVFGPLVAKLPVSKELRRYASALLRAQAPADASARAIHRFRRATEPWALDALAFVGATELADAVRMARTADPAEPLVRGNELGLPPGPGIGRVLEQIEEERAAGTITTREEALELARTAAANDPRESAPATSPTPHPPGHP